MVCETFLKIFWPSWNLRIWNSHDLRLIVAHTQEGGNWKSYSELWAAQCDARSKGPISTGSLHLLGIWKVYQGEMSWLMIHWLTCSDPWFKTNGRDMMIHHLIMLGIYVYIYTHIVSLYTSTLHIKLHSPNFETRTWFHTTCTPLN